MNMPKFYEEEKNSFGEEGANPPAAHANFIDTTFNFFPEILQK